jgi:hypothetical protein
MDGTIIDYVKYIEGYSRLGEQTIQVVLYALPTNLTVAHYPENKPLFSIPWDNLSNMQMGYVEKRGLESAGAFLFRTIPVVGSLRAFDSHYDGIWVTFWDADIERNQSVYFATRSDRHASQLIQRILTYRDSYYRQAKKVSSPQRR